MRKFFFIVVWTENFERILKEFSQYGNNIQTNNYYETDNHSKFCKLQSGCKQSRRMTMTTMTTLTTHRKIEEGGSEQDDSQQERTGGFQHL